MTQDAGAVLDQARAIVSCAAFDSSLATVELDGVIYRIPVVKCWPVGAEVGDLAFRRLPGGDGEIRVFDGYSWAPLAPRR